MDFILLSFQEFKLFLGLKAYNTNLTEYITVKKFGGG